MQPLFAFWMEEPALVRGALFVQHFRSHHEPIGLIVLPIKIKKRLASCAFVAKSTNSYAFALVQQFHSQLIFHSIRIVLVARIPNGKDQ
ncbi:MAG: hypothetical protein R3C28_10645 [Pirellulaceae bacterium]